MPRWADDFDLAIAPSPRHAADPCVEGVAPRRKLRGLPRRWRPGDRRLAVGRFDRGSMSDARCRDGRNEAISRRSAAAFDSATGSSRTRVVAVAAPDEANGRDPRRAPRTTDSTE